MWLCCRIIAIAAAGGGGEEVPSRVGEALAGVAAARGIAACVRAVRSSVCRIRMAWTFKIAAPPALPPSPSQFLFLPGLPASSAVGHIHIFIVSDQRGWQQLDRMRCPCVSCTPWLRRWLLLPPPASRTKCNFRVPPAGRRRAVSKRLLAAGRAALATTTTTTAATSASQKGCGQFAGTFSRQRYVCVCMSVSQFAERKPHSQPERRERGRYAQDTKDAAGRRGEGSESA